MSDSLWATANSTAADSAQTLELRRSISVPKGTTFRFDAEYFDELVAGGMPPQRSDEHSVAKVWPPGAEQDAFEDYTHSDLESVFEGLSSEERQQLTSSVESARALVLPMLLRRHIYVDGPDWVDDESDEPSPGT
jgi:hypothetical protein